MKVFISSLITGFEPFRAAAQSAITTLRHDPVMAEDFGAQPHSPQIACLRGLRSSDLVVLILGERYGSVQGPSGVSPTHEEYLEARGRKPILVFVQEGVITEPQQTNFIAEVQGWQGGHFRAGFQTVEELRNLVTRAIHDYELANAAGPLDTASLSRAAIELLPPARRNSHTGIPMLHVSLVGGPVQRILRPSELEAPVLAKEFKQQALFREPTLFVDTKGTETSIEGDALCLEQEGGASIRLNEYGSLLLRLPLVRPQGTRGSATFVMMAIIEEDVMRELESAIQFAAWALDYFDATQRLTHVAIAATIESSDYLGWRTQAEQDASPNAGTMRMGGQERALVKLDRPRAALRFQVSALAEDLMVPLRRQWKS